MIRNINFSHSIKRKHFFFRKSKIFLVFIFPNQTFYWKVITQRRKYISVDLIHFFPPHFATTPFMTFFLPFVKNFRSIGKKMLSQAFQLLSSIKENILASLQEYTFSPSFILKDKLWYLKSNMQVTHLARTFLLYTYLSLFSVWPLFLSEQNTTKV